MNLKRGAFVGLFAWLLGAPALARADTDVPLEAVRMFWAKSSETDLITGFAGDFDASQESSYMIGASWGRKYSDTLFGLPIPMTANVGLQYVNERGYQPDIYGVNAYIKAHYDLRLPWTQKKVRLGFGEGLSYFSRIPMSEQRDFAKKGAESEKLLNYLEWTIDLPLKQFASVDALIHNRLEELNVGFMVFHRSSIFGLMAESKGGVNFMGFAIEAKF